MSKITLEEYAMGRDELYPDEWAIARPNAIVLLQQVNAFLEELFPGLEVQVASGFRPKEINEATANAAKNSLHMIGKAVDIKDFDGSLKAALNPAELHEQAVALRKFNLFMEDPAATPTWVHLDIGLRADRASRIFKP